MASGTLQNPNSIRYIDITHDATNGIVPISASTSYAVSQDNFLNALVRDANDLIVNVYTYNNLVYGRVTNVSSGTAITGEVHLRAFYRV